MQFETDEDDLYYFTTLANNRYETMFIGWLTDEMIKAFEEVDGVESFANIKLTVGENTFVANIGAPLYLLNYENDDIFEFAGDNNELDLYPSGNIPDDLDMEPIIDYPTYVTREVEPLIDFKLFNRFYANNNGVWVPLDI